LIIKKEGYGDPAAYINRLHVEEECFEHPYAKEIIKRVALPLHIIKRNETPEISGQYPDNLTRGKRHLFLRKNRGDFFKPCPATREYRCCNYQVLNIGMGCPIDCVYCILQAYLNNPWTSFFVNIEDMFAELDSSLSSLTNDDFFRIGTGEFTDSLALDSLTGLSRYLVPYMKDKKRAVLELKTKSVAIENLKGLEHGGRTIVAWSLNSPAIMNGEEIRAASLGQRLEAAVRCADWGYKLAFHFDPIIYHDNWRAGYLQTIQTLFERVPADKIAWISLGALRYLPSLKEIAIHRFPGSDFFYEEFIDGLDGKSRYFRSLRVEMYKVIVDELAKHVSPKTCIYFCMENDTIWREVFGFVPKERGGLPAMLDMAVTITA
jgi:spore photoproduct lyase